MQLLLADILKIKKKALIFYIYICSLQCLQRIMYLFIDAYQDIRPGNWFLSEDYQQFIKSDSLDWDPEQEYYIRLIARLVDSILL